MRRLWRTSLHIYEDQVTHLGSPFALGLTLSQLRLESTDEQGKIASAKQTQQTINMFHKTLILEGLAFYWNAHTQVYSKLDDLTKLQKFLSEVATKDHQPLDYTYMFGPISAGAQLQMNPKPEVENFKNPKFKLDMHMDTLSIGITKMQYRDLVKFLESMDQMARAAPYRKYRPNLNKYRGYYSIWWHFAYQCILETEVRRRRNNFNWDRIRKHRAMCRDYEAAYKQKLEAKKPSAELLKILEDLERKLDPFNLIIMRQRAEVKVQKTRKQEEENKKNAGWFSGWWGGGAQKQNQPASGTAADLANKFEAAMTAEEKAKLYQAIGYQENAAPAQFPPEFVAVVASFSLGKLLVNVQDEELPGRSVLKLELSNVTSKIQQRPSALANRVEVKMQRLSVIGCQQDGVQPVLACSLTSAGHGSLLDVLFETNPEDRSCDQRVRVTSQPLELVYDAQTVNHLIDVFNPPEKPSLSQLQAMAVSKLEEIREVSATLLQHAIQQQKVLELDIKFAASRLLLPQGGKMIKCGENQCSVPLLVVSLGSLSVHSKPRDPELPSISHLLQAGSTEEEVLQEMIAQSYDRFKLSLHDMQVLVANAKEDWQSKLLSPEDSTLHLVQPTSIDIALHRSLLPNDPRIPQFKVAGQLPALSLSLSEERLLLMAGIFASVPWPESEEPEQPTLQESSSRASSIATLQQLGKVDRRHSKSEALELVVGSVKLELSFEMKELRVTVLRGTECMLDFSLLALEFEVCQRPFDLTVRLRLGGVCMKQAVGGLHPQIISTPMAQGRADYLFTTRLVMVDRKSPELHTKHGSVEKLLEIFFTSLDVLLHQTAILELMKFSSELQEKINALQSKAPKDRVGNTKPAMDRLLSVIPEDGGAVVKPSGNLGNCIC
ncbi:hypothetical protein B566_EDAN005234 [Ephemera danica]|nr:hypothetical protein B566_EDAN005234 [Ephemera danica]